MLKLPENLSRESVEVFGAIMRFMGDSGKKPTPKQEVEYPIPFLLSFIFYLSSFILSHFNQRIIFTKLDTRTTLLAGPLVQKRSVTRFFAAWFAKLPRTPKSTALLLLLSSTAFVLFLFSFNFIHLSLTIPSSRESAVRGWQLLALCLGCVPPSETMIKYLCGFMQNTVKVYLTSYILHLAST